MTRIGDLIDEAGAGATAFDGALAATGDRVYAQRAAIRGCRSWVRRSSPVGRDVHSVLCVDDEGSTCCVCGLDDDRSADRADERTGL